MQFHPKDGGEEWFASLNHAQGSGYDGVLFLDVVEGATDGSGFMIEFGIGADGAFHAQITSRPGSDAIAMLRVTRDSITVGANDGASHRIVNDEGEAPGAR